MAYTIIVNDKSYELPKKTVANAEKLDKVLKIDSIAGLSVREKFKKLHEFVKEMIGNEAAAEMLGSDRLDEIDTAELAVIVLKINAAYEKPMEEFKAERMQERIGNIPFEQLTSMTKAAQTVANVQAMKS